jgi:hypothetical protein
MADLIEPESPISILIPNGQNLWTLMPKFVPVFCLILNFTLAF